MSLTCRLLASTAFVALCASPALAAWKSPDGRHSFSGGIKTSYVADSNIGSAPSNPAGGPDTGDDDEEFNLDDELDDDALDDILEEVDADTEDLAEDEAGDDDADGLPDLLDDEAPVAGTGKGDGDERVQSGLALKHAYTSEDAKNLTWKSGLTFGLNEQHDRQDLDRRNWGINSGPEFTFKEWGLKINPSLTFLDLDVRDNNQMQSTIASLGASWKITKKWAVQARYNHEVRNNQKARVTDIDVDGLKIGAKYVLGKNLFSAAYMPKLEDNENQVKNKAKHGFQFGYARKLPWKMQGDLGFRYGNSDFINLAPGRIDDDYQYTAKLTKKFAHGLYADLGVVHKSRDSSIDKKDSNGQTIFVSTGWKF